MATYRSIASTETDPQAPITSSLMKALEANPIAIAEGDSTAPRIHAKALGSVYIGTMDVNSGSYATFTDLDGTGWVKVDFSAELEAGITLRVAFSNDNGSSWGSDISILSIAGISTALKGTFSVSLQTGLSVREALYCRKTTSVDNQTVYASSTLTVPANCNAMRMRAGTSGATNILRGVVFRRGGIE